MIPKAKYEINKLGRNRAWELRASLAYTTKRWLKKKLLSASLWRGGVQQAAYYQ